MPCRKINASSPDPLFRYVGTGMSCPPHSRRKSWRKQFVEDGMRCGLRTDEAVFQRSEIIAARCTKQQNLHSRRGMYRIEFAADRHAQYLQQIQFEARRADERPGIFFRQIA